MLATLAKGFGLGLSTGTICLATCTPIYLPYLLTEDRKLTKSLWKVTEISLGRFFSYLAFGAAAGFAGANISSVNREIFTSIAYILLSIYLLISAYRAHKTSHNCHVSKMMNLTKNGFILGILTGINFCPAFLIALSQAIDLGGTFSGMNLFFGFFLGTTLFLIPLAFANLLTHLKGMKKIAQIVSILIAIWFIWQGISGIIHWQKPTEKSTEKRIVEVFHPRADIFMIRDNKNSAYFLSLKAKIQNVSQDSLSIILFDDHIDWNKIMNADYPILIYDLALQNDFTNLKRIDHIGIEANYSIDQIVTFLKKYTFQTENFLEWKFEMKQGDIK